MHHLTLGSRVIKSKKKKKKRARRRHAQVDHDHLVSRRGHQADFGGICLNTLQVSDLCPYGRKEFAYG